MSKSNQIMVKFVSRSNGNIVDKHIQDMFSEIPFDMELVAAQGKKIGVHRFVVSMFSPYFRDMFRMSNLYLHGTAIVPMTEFSLEVLTKAIELFYQCYVIIPSLMSQPLKVLLKKLKVDGIQFENRPAIGNFVTEHKLPMAPPNNSGFKGTIIQSTKSVPPLPNNRRYSIAVTPAKRPRPDATPVKIPPGITLKPSQPQPKPRASIAMLTAQSTVAPNSQIQPKILMDKMTIQSATDGHLGQRDSGPVLDEINKIAESAGDEKELLDNQLIDGDGNKENLRPDLHHDIDLSTDDTFTDFMSRMSNEVDLVF